MFRVLLHLSVILCALATARHDGSWRPHLSCPKVYLGAFQLLRTTEKAGESCQRGSQHRLVLQMQGPNPARAL